MYAPMVLASSANGVEATHRNPIYSQFLWLNWTFFKTIQLPGNISFYFAEFFESRHNTNCGKTYE